MNNRYIDLFLRASRPSNEMSGRNVTSGFNDTPGSSSSRRGASGENVSNSAYIGFYGTSLYKTADSAGKF